MGRIDNCIREWGAGTSAFALFALGGLPFLVRQRLGAGSAPALRQQLVHADVDELLVLCGVGADRRDGGGLDGAPARPPAGGGGGGGGADGSGGGGGGEGEGLTLVVLLASAGAVVYSVAAAWVGYATEHICYMTLLWTLVPALVMAALPPSAARRAPFAYAVYLAAVLARAPEFLGPALTHLTRSAAGALPLAAGAREAAGALLLIAAMQLFHGVVTRVAGVVAGPATPAAARFIFVAQAYMYCFWYSTMGDSDMSDAAFVCLVVVMNASYVAEAAGATGEVVRLVATVGARLARAAGCRGGGGAAADGGGDRCGAPAAVACGGAEEDGSDGEMRFERLVAEQDVLADVGCLVVVPAVMSALYAVGDVAQVRARRRAPSRARAHLWACVRARVQRTGSLTGYSSMDIRVLWLRFGLLAIVRSVRCAHASVRVAARWDGVDRGLHRARSARVSRAIFAWKLQVCPPVLLWGMSSCCTRARARAPSRRRPAGLAVPSAPRPTPASQWRSLATTSGTSRSSLRRACSRASSSSTARRGGRSAARCHFRHGSSTRRRGGTGVASTDDGEGPS